MACFSEVKNKEIRELSEYFLYFLVYKDDSVIATAKSDPNLQLKLL